MVTRPNSQYQNVTQVVAKQDTYTPSSRTQLAGQFADIGLGIIKQNQEAKITENFAKAQLDIQKLNQDYQVANEGDPFNEEAQQSYKEARDGIFKQYGDEISPFFKRDWEINTKQLGATDDISMQSWGFRQSQKNTVQSLKKGMEANFTQATISGQDFGKGDQTDVGTLLDFTTSGDKLRQYATRNLGETSTNELMSSYNQDYLRSFLSGVSETNPVKALQILDDPEIQKNFGDQDQYAKMRSAIENRAINVEEIATQKEVLSTLKEENATFARSLQEPLSYAAVQQATSGMSEQARKYFMRANGYSTAEGDGVKYNPAEKALFKSDLYEEIQKVASNPNATSQDIAKLQERVYLGMNKHAIDETEGQQFISQIINPFVDRKEETLKNFSDGGWVSDDVGLRGVRDNFYQKYAIPVNNEPTTAAERREADYATTLNNARKSKYYDYYMESLAAGAASYGIPVGDVQKLSKVQRRELYSEAQKNAERIFQLDETPALAGLNDTPNQILKSGVLQPGSTGVRNLQTNANSNGGFELFKGSDGFLYRKYSNGKYEKAERWK